MTAIQEYQIRSQESFHYTLEIKQPFGKLDEVLQWCKTALDNEWRWQLVEPSSDIRLGRYNFYFDSERDYCAFTLRWG